MSLWRQPTLQLWPGIVLYCHRRSRAFLEGAQGPASWLVVDAEYLYNIAMRAPWILAESLMSRQKGRLTTTSVRGFMLRNTVRSARPPLSPVGGDCRHHASYFQWRLQSTTSYCTVLPRKRRGYPRPSGADSAPEVETQESPIWAAHPHPLTSFSALSSSSHSQRWGR